LLIFYITYDDFYDDCIVDVRGIMTKGRFIVDRYDHNENSISRAEAIINCALFASYSSGTLENEYYIDDG